MQVQAVPSDGKLGTSLNPLQMPLDGHTPDQDEYFALRDKLKALWEVPVPDMQAIEAVMQRLDDCHARVKATHKREDDTQRY